MENALMRVNHPQSEPELTVFSNREVDRQSASSAFIEANTVSVHFKEIKEEHIIPVYVKDNEPLVSQSDFIQTTQEVVSDLFRGERILRPQIRCSHPIKGRVPEAKDKPANQLEEWEKTLYYERMMFVIEVSSIYDDIDGNTLSLTVGGVKAYNLDNLYNKKGAAEHFKLFIGFQNMVCTNLCVRTDGFMSDLRVSSLDQLHSAVYQLLNSYDQHRHLKEMKSLGQHSITEQQFAQLLGRCRMYPHLPIEDKKLIQPLLYGDSQISAVCRDYYRDVNFCRQDDGKINLWKLYNLFTGANKSTYIDQFLDRSVNALDFASQIKEVFEENRVSWYLS